MALYAELNGSMTVWTDSTKTTSKADWDIPNKVVEAFVQAISYELTIPIGATDQAISLSGLTGKLVTLKSESAFTVKFNSNTGTPLSLTPIQRESDLTITPAFLAMLASNITSIFVTNPGTNPLTLEVCVAA